MLGGMMQPVVGSGSTIQAADLSAALQDAIGTLAVSTVDNADGTGTATIQLKDAAGNNLSQRGLVRVWTSGRAGADMGAPVAIAVGFSVAGGTEIEEVTADADRIVLSEADGSLSIDPVDDAQDGTLWVMAEYAGIVVSASVAITGT